MRTVSFKSVLRGVLAREGGGNLIDADASEPMVAKAIEFIADRVRTAWEYYAWPEIFETEERYFRAEWEAGETYAAGDEVRFTDSEGETAYYTPVAGDLPAAGESPEDEPDKWEELTDFRRFVAFDQEGETAFEACVGAWDEDPEANACADKLRFRVTRDGILIEPGQCSGASVWLKIRRKTPDFAAQVYAADAEYAVGEPVYFEDEGEVFRCLEATAAGQTPETNPAKWELEGFPMIFARAVKAGALADWQRSDGEGSAVKTRDSEDRFIELLDEQVWQLTKLQGQTGRPDVDPGA
jgi:hypothetical protein